MFLASCQQENREQILLGRVEDCIGERPDSALLLLNQLQYPHKLCGKERVDYALLLSQALDKNYMDSLLSDSLIEIAVDYYKNSGDKCKAGKAYYYYGKIVILQNKASQAMQAYLDALALLKGTNEYKLQGLALEHIDYLNLGQGENDNSIDNYRKSVYHYKLAGDSVGTVYGSRNIARGYLAEQRNDSARWYANKALLSLRDTTNRVRASLWQILGLVANNEKRYSQAVAYFTIAAKENKGVSDGFRYYLSLGRAYLDMKQFDKAEKCFNLCRNIDDVFVSSGVYNYLYLLQKEKKNYKDALLYREKSDSLFKIVRNQDLNHELLALQKKYETDVFVFENKQMKLEKESHTYLFLLLLLLLVIVLCTGCIFYIRRRYKNKFLRNIASLRKNEQVIENYACRITELERSGKLERETKKEEIGKLNRKILFLTVKNKEMRENTSIEALFVLGKLKEGKLVVECMEASERQCLYDFLDRVHTGFISRIMAEFNLTKGELLLAALLKFGFSNQHLMIVFDCELKSVHKSKQRLKKHLNLSKEDVLERMIMLY